MLDELSKGLNDLKKKIQYLEDTEKEINSLEKRSFKASNTERRLKELQLSSQEQKITFNVSGTLVTLSQSFIKNTKFKNVLKDNLNNKQDAATINSEVFFDVPLIYFEKALEILRLSDKDFTSDLKQSLTFFENDLHEDDKFDLKSLDFQLNLAKITNLKAFYEFLKDFFKTDFDKVVAQYKLPYKDEDEEEGKDLTKLITNHEVTSSFNVNEVLTFYVAENTKDIFKSENNKAFFLDSPDGEIIFEFSKNVRISSITTKPFSELQDAWFPELRPKILTSLDNKEWDVVYTPDQYTETYSVEESTIKIESKLLKYIKFKANQSVFSLSYLKVNS